MWHKPCQTFHPWCPCIKTRCLCPYVSHMPSGHLCVTVLFDMKNDQLWSWHLLDKEVQVWIGCQLQAWMCNYDSVTYPPVNSGFPSQGPATRSFHVFLDLRLNKRLTKQWRRRWFEMPLHTLWRHCNAKHQYSTWSACTVPHMWPLDLSPWWHDNCPIIKLAFVRQGSAGMDWVPISGQKVQIGAGCQLQALRENH